VIVLHNHTVYKEREDKRNRGKMKDSVSGKAGDISIVQKRLEILWSTRFTDRSEVEEAVKIQERLSKKSPEGWSGTEEIRRFREREAVGKSPYRF
jgi:hypothetical protein